VCRQLSPSALADKAVLVTAGPTPVRVDRVRVMTNIFRGALGEALAHELVARGAHLRFLFGGDPERLPKYLRPLTVAYRDFDEYRTLVRDNVADGHSPGVPFAGGIFSAAVADYKPETVFDGKIASGAGEGISLPRFVPTPKIIDEVRGISRTLPMVTFKLLAGVSEEALLAEAHRRLEKFQVVVANRLEDLKKEGGSLRWIVSRTGDEQYRGSNLGLAVRIVDHLERYVADNYTTKEQP
jgi:phosphopantothenoylcysteine decarboxylase/phosphopantothenate--cysteine ligase